MPGLYAKETLTLQQIEVCDVQFTLTLDVFDGKDTAVSIHYFIPDAQEAMVIKNNPIYFTTDTKNCGSANGSEPMKVWKDANTFIIDLKAGKTDALTQDWYNDFSKIASTFKFTK